MEIPKKIEKLLDRRERLAEQLIEVSSELDEWLENKGVDLGQYPLCDCTITGCRIYCEPNGAKETIREYINTKL